MNTPKYTHRLGQVRVTDEMHEGIEQGCLSLGMTQADFVRAALQEYLTPGQPPEMVAVPIAGKLKAVDGEYIVLPVGLLNSAPAEFNIERPNGQEGER